MNLIRLSQSNPHYPPVLKKYLDKHAPKTMYALGNLEILNQSKTALFCSVKCPGSLILKTYDLAREWRDAGVTVISGFHSPMEKECLALLLRGKQPVIWCLARSVEKMRIKKEHQNPLCEGHLLILSPFLQRYNRISALTSWYCNQFIAALADSVFIAHADPGSKTEKFCHTIHPWGKPLYTFPVKENINLVTLGAKPVSLDTTSKALLYQKTMSF